MKLPFRIAGGLLCSYWTYGIAVVAYRSFNGDVEAQETLWVIPLAAYALVLMFPYIILNRFPQWVRNIVPKKLLNLLLANYLKDFNTKLRDLPDV